MKKVLVAAVVSTVLVLSMGGQAAPAAGSAVSSDGSSPGPTFSAAPTTSPDRPRPDRTSSAPSSATHADRHRAKGKGPGRYHVPTGPYFNNPRGSWTARMRIEHQVMRAIKATKKGAVIRIALYSFDRVPVARALIAAKKRGVHIQMLLNDHQDTKAMKMVRAYVGTNTRKRDFLYKCHHGCRTDNNPNRFLHTKFYTFTKTGGSKWALFFGSANLTMNAMRHQWNDLYLMDGDKPLFKQYVYLFNDMKKDYNKQQPPLPNFCGVPANGVSCDDAVDSDTTVTFPRTLGPGNDPIIKILDRVRCLTTLPNGKVIRTKLVVNMHTIRGHRGDYLADAYRHKFAEGCQARFSFGLVGARTKGHLGAKTARGRMPLRSTGFDYHPDSDPVPNPDGKVDLSLDYYSHQKFMVIEGNYAGNPHARMVFTGSSNWGALGAVNDEIWVSVIGKKVARQYMSQFNFEWRPGNSRNAYTTTYTHFRVPVVRMGADGQKVTTYRTGTRRHVTVDPSLVYHPNWNYGPYWEDD